MLAIIPARGGSKGLPGKNIKELKGKPMIAYAIEAALKSSFISIVFVSTDDEEIAEVARKHGAHCPSLRPSSLATDDAMAVDTYNYVLDLMAEKSGDISELIILQPTSPLRTVEDIDGAIKLFKQRDADSVISYCEDSKPIFWSKYISSNGNLENIFPENIDNRQNLKPTYHPNGAIYIFKSKMIRDRVYYSEKTFAYVMPHERSVDIDTLSDFEYAEFLMTRVAEKK